MTILHTSGWAEYALLDSGDGKRLERFGKYIIVRPDPQCLWMPRLDENEWKKVDAEFAQGDKRDKGDRQDKWIRKNGMPEKWEMEWEDLRFQARLTPFKHTGVFPEQSVQWEWMRERLGNRESERRNGRDQKINVLNLFGYTGIASLVCAASGAQITHVDGSYPAIGWARENQRLSGLIDKPIRWIEDDCLKFVHRELKRGIRYDGIIMDPPVYGHGPNGEVWDFSKHFPELLKICRQLLSDNPLFLLVNAYAISMSSLMLENVLTDYLGDLGGKITVGELALEEKDSKRLLSTGIFGRWEVINK